MKTTILLGTAALAALLAWPQDAEARHGSTKVVVNVIERPAHHHRHRHHRPIVVNHNVPMRVSGYTPGVGYRPGYGYRPPLVHGTKRHAPRYRSHAPRYHAPRSHYRAPRHGRSGTSVEIRLRTRF